MTGPANAAALEDALRALGVDCFVEAHGRLAVVVPRGAVDFTDPARRQAALRLVTEHGFTHLALELVDATDDARERAADDGVDGGSDGGAALHRDQLAD